MAGQFASLLQWWEVGRSGTVAEQVASLLQREPGVTLGGGGGALNKTLRAPVILAARQVAPSYRRMGE